LQSPESNTQTEDNDVETAPRDSEQSQSAHGELELIKDDTSLEVSDDRVRAEQYNLHDDQDVISEQEHLLSHAADQSDHVGVPEEVNYASAQRSSEAKDVAHALEQGNAAEDVDIIGDTTEAAIDSTLFEEQKSRRQSRLIDLDDSEFPDDDDDEEEEGVVAVLPQATTNVAAANRNDTDKDVLDVRNRTFPAGESATELQPTTVADSKKKRGLMGLFRRGDRSRSKSRDRDPLTQEPLLTVAPSNIQTGAEDPRNEVELVENEDAMAEPTNIDEISKPAENFGDTYRIDEIDSHLQGEPASANQTSEVSSVSIYVPEKKKRRGIFGFSNRKDIATPSERETQPSAPPGPSSRSHSTATATPALAPSETDQLPEKTKKRGLFGIGRRAKMKAAVNQEDDRPSDITPLASDLNTEEGVSSLGHPPVIKPSIADEEETKNLEDPNKLVSEVAGQDTKTTEETAVLLSETAELLAEKETTDAQEAARVEVEEEEKARLLAETQAEEEAARLKAEEEEKARLLAAIQAEEDEAKLKAEEAARKKADEEEKARLLAEKQAEEEATRLKLEEEEEQARFRAAIQAEEEEARLKAEEAARLKAEEEENARLLAKKQAEEEAARLKAEEEEKARLLAEKQAEEEAELKAKAAREIEGKEKEKSKSSLFSILQRRREIADSGKDPGDDLMKRKKELQDDKPSMSTDLAAIFSRRRQKTESSNDEQSIDDKIRRNHPLETSTVKMNDEVQMALLRRRMATENAEADREDDRVATTTQADENDREEEERLKDNVQDEDETSKGVLVLVDDEEEASEEEVVDEEENFEVGDEEEGDILDVDDEDEASDVEAESGEEDSDAEAESREEDSDVESDSGEEDSDLEADSGDFDVEAESEDEDSEVEVESDEEDYNGEVENEEDMEDEILEPGDESDIENEEEEEEIGKDYYEVENREHQLEEESEIEEEILDDESEEYEDIEVGDAAIEQEFIADSVNEIAVVSDDDDNFENAHSVGPTAFNEEIVDDREATSKDNKSWFWWKKKKTLAEDQLELNTREQQQVEESERHAERRWWLRKADLARDESEPEAHDENQEEESEEPVKRSWWKRQGIPEMEEPLPDHGDEPFAADSRKGDQMEDKLDSDSHDLKQREAAKIPLMRRWLTSTEHVVGDEIESEVQDNPQNKEGVIPVKSDWKVKTESSAANEPEFDHGNASQKGENKPREKRGWWTRNEKNSANAVVDEEEALMVISADCELGASDRWDSTGNKNTSIKAAGLDNDIEMQRDDPITREMSDTAAKTIDSESGKDAERLWPGQHGSKRCLLLMGILLIAIGIAAGVGIGIAVGEDDQADPTIESTSAPTGAPSEAVPIDPNQKQAYDLLCPLIANCESLLDLETPQGTAFKWLTESELNVTDDLRIIQRYALATLYYSTNGDLWTDNSDWVTDADECLWFSSSSYSQRCSTDNELLVLSLNDNNLQGELPHEISLLTTLTSISIRNPRDNTPSLTGGIPSGVISLSALSSLVISGNSFEGPIPSEIGKLSRLQQLDLSFNSLQGDIPGSFSLLIEITFLDLSGNLLGSIPSDVFSSLSMLKEINLEANNFTAIPDSISSLSSLEKLNLKQNSLEEFPLGVLSVTTLQDLDLSENIYGGSSIPEQISNLVNLRQLNMKANNLISSIPSTIGQLTQLQRLDLSENSLQGTIPTNLGGATNVRQLLLNSNQLEGPVPADLALMTSIEIIRIDDNDLTGILPNEICALYDSIRPASYADCSEIITFCFSYCCEDGEGCTCRFETSDPARCLVR
jgi:Leucine-rich repeat (LRR) protein